MNLSNLRKRLENPTLESTERLKRLKLLSARKDGNRYHLTKLLGVQLSTDWVQFVQSPDFLWALGDPVQRPAGNDAGKKRQYMSAICAFDIETSNIPAADGQAVAYQWQWATNVDGRILCVMGRSMDSAAQFLQFLGAKMPPETHLITYVHNLAFEFQFLKGVISFDNDDVFAVRPRKPLKVDLLGLELRCSELLTNMSLDVWTHKMGVAHSKLTGTYDYTKIVYPWSTQAIGRLMYDLNDVVGLTEAVRAQMARDNDTVYTLPMTSTGYVRRDAKKIVRATCYYNFRGTMPTYDQYKLLRQAFRGGNCHANRWYSGRILRNVDSFDRSSSYPDVICNCPFPSGHFKTIDNPTWEKYQGIKRLGMAALCRVILYNVDLKEIWWGCPYIPTAKCTGMVHPICDNGRVLMADSLEMCLTDIDLDIILSEYNVSGIVFCDLLTCAYEMLPRSFVRLVISYYRKKTELKGVAGQEIFYAHSKELLNSLYGMMATDPGKIDIFFDGEDMYPDPKITGKAAFNRGTKKAFLPYTFGVWVTAWARLRLEEGIRLTGPDFVYADTDSVKYLHNDKIDWTSYNAQRIKDSTQSGAFATDPAGTTHFMGVYEREKSYDQFVTRGAKKYAYLQGGKLGVTVSGVNKAKAGPELERAGGLKAFCQGNDNKFVFKEAGGLLSTYNDQVDKWLIIDGHRLHVTDNVTLTPDTYSLGISVDYERLLSGYYDEQLYKILKID